MSYVKNFIMSICLIVLVIILIYFVKSIEFMLPTNAILLIQWLLVFSLVSSILYMWMR